MTSAPAQKMGLWDRGLLREGMWADITVFNPNTIIDHATFDDPHRHPSGIEYVVINGQLVISHGAHTGILAGRVLRNTKT
jgi:N-acyl-D-amino-acid deacylase